jgi:hypothetical protein
VAGVPRLAAEVTLAAVLGRRLGRLDDVAGGRLGGIRRVLLEAGDLVAKLLVVTAKLLVGLTQLLVVAAQLLILLAELLVLPPQRGYLGLERFQPRQQPFDA